MKLAKVFTTGLMLIICLGFSFNADAGVDSNPNSGIIEKKVDAKSGGIDFVIYKLGNGNKLKLDYSNAVNHANLSQLEKLLDLAIQKDWKVKSFRCTSKNNWGEFVFKGHLSHPYAELIVIGKY